MLHPEYGLGRIVAVEGAGPNRKGRVAFAVGPERTFVLARSPLRTVGRSSPDGRAAPPRRRRESPEPYRDRPTSGDGLSCRGWA